MERRSVFGLALASIGCAFDVGEEGEIPMIRQSRNPPVYQNYPNGIPQVVATTPREGMWSGYNQLGYQAKYGPDQRNTQTILKMDEWGMPEIWTVSLFLKGNFTAYDGFSIKARINFGAGGSTQTIEMDWANGAQISLPMNAVNVQAIFDDVEVSTEGAGMMVGVQLSRGTRGGTQAPILTIIEKESLATLTSGTLVEIPSFVSAIYAIPALNTASFITDFYSALTRLNTVSGNAPGTVAGALLGSQLALGMKLPVNGTARLAQFFNGTANQTIYSLIGELYG